MKSIREQLQKGKLYCLTHKGARQQNTRSGRWVDPGQPMLFLEFRGSGSGLATDSYKFLIGEKIEEVGFRGENHLVRKKLEQYIIPLHEWEEYLTFYTEYHKEINNGPIQIHVQSIPIKARTIKLPANVTIEVMKDIQVVHTVEAEKELTKMFTETTLREISLQKKNQH